MGHYVYQSNLGKLFRLNDAKYFKFITFAITLLEVLVKPLKEDKPKIVDEYKTILTNAQSIDIFEIDTPIAIKSAEIRARYNFRTPDALQIATALIHGAHYFFTNDLRLKSITEIKLLTISDLT